MKLALNDIDELATMLSLFERYSKFIIPLGRLNVIIGHEREK
jgi:hypothetical protein